MYCCCIVITTSTVALTWDSLYSVFHTYTDVLCLQSTSSLDRLCLHWAVCAHCS